MMIISSCSSEEPFEEQNRIPTDTQVNNYLTVNIVSAVSPSTRGDGDNVDGDKAGNYVDGTDLEQKVNTIRFFFFDANGNGAPVSVETTATESTPVSYIDWTHTDNDLGAGDRDETVSATLTATLGLAIPDGYDNPTSLIAVINPSTAVKNLTAGQNTFGPTMSQVQDLAADFETGLTDGNFVMSNSVYANTAGSAPKTVNYTDLVVNTAQGEIPYFQSNIEAAQAHPVTIYVERVVARLDLKIGLTANAKGYYPVMKKVEGGQDMQVSIDVNGDGEEELIYVNFLGWNTTSTPDKSYLVKNIVPTWTSTQLFGASNLLWNSMDFHRSFWAKNPNGVTFQYGNFGNPSGKDVPGNEQPARANPMPATGQFATTYLLENASPYSGTLLNPEHPTQVIVAAQLVTENGTPVELAEWGYKKYTQPDLLKYLVTNIISKGRYYKKVSDTNYVSLQPGDLKFISASQYYPSGLPTNVERYYSYIVLSTDENTSWYQWNGEGEAPTATTVVPVQPSTINDYILNNVGYTMMWNSGYTYYYFDIRHLGESNSPAFYGVVRNHIYEATVKTLYGYGTPVCDPDEIIIPQAPKYEEVILAAEIRILQWRVVSSDYEFNWR